VELQIRGNDIAITNGLLEFASERTEKLDHLLGRVGDAKLELRKVHNRTGGDIIAAQLTVQTGPRVFRAEERAQDPGRAIDLVIEKMASQVRRFHNKRSKRKVVRPQPVNVNGLGAPDDSIGLLSTDEDEERELESRIVRTKRFAMKPMLPAEAVEQMELLGHEFFLFLNAEEAQLNVIYRRRDGNYGVLAPEVV